MFELCAKRLACVSAAERKCLTDAQDFPYISAGMAGPDIKVWGGGKLAARELRKWILNGKKRAVFHVVILEASCTSGTCSAHTHILYSH